MMSRLRTIALIALALLLSFRPLRAAADLKFFEQREVLAPPSPALAVQPNQVVIPLNGLWDYRVGEDGGYRAGWLPGSFRGEEAQVDFRRDFVLPDSLRQSFFQLHLPEVHHTVEVWVNGTFVASFTGSHLGAICEIPRDHLRFGAANQLMLRTDNRLSPRLTLPLRSSAARPANYGGVFSGVYLRVVPAWSIENASLVPGDVDDVTAIRAGVRVQVTQRASLSRQDEREVAESEVRVRAALYDSSGYMVAETVSEVLRTTSGAGYRATLPLPRFAGAPWSPATPALYRLVAELVMGNEVLHRFEREVGFRRIEVRGRELLLNGDRLAVRGIDYVPEDFQSGRAIAPSQLRDDLTRIRELGLNAVRVPLAPPPPALVRIADQIGLLVLVETDLQAVPTDVLSRGAYLNLAERSFERMQDEYGDHPSVLAWGVGAQLDWRDAEVREFTASLRDRMRGTGYVPCYASSADPELLQDLVDFVLLPLADEGAAAAVGTARRSSLPVIVSDVRQLAAGYATPGGVAAGVSRQAEELVRELRELHSSEDVAGYFVHAFSDYHGSTPLLAQPQQPDPLLYSYGLVTFDRQERLVLSKVRDIVHAGDVSAPVPAESKRPEPSAFPVVGLAALVLLSVELRRNNVFRHNLKRVFFHAHGFYSDLRYRRFLHTAQPLLLLLLEALTLSLLLGSALYALRHSPALDYYLSHFLPWPEVKAWLVGLIWDPARLIAYFSALFAALILAQMILVRLTALFFRERVDLWQSANYVIWAYAALLYLLPLGIIFHRMLNTPGFAAAGLTAVAGGLAWSFVRLLSALRTGYGTSPVRVWAAVLGIGVILAAGTLILLEARLGTLTHLQFYHDVLAAR